MSITVPIALFGWIPLVIALFAFLPARRAAIVSFIAGWMFLPWYGYPLPGLPDYTKISAVSLGVFLSMLIFDMPRLTSLRPRWFDLPVVVWCVCPFISEMAYNMAIYDGLSAMQTQIVNWGLPYLIGRVYMDDLRGLYDLAMGIVISALIYAPFCLYEMRFSPMLNRMVYGFSQHNWSGHRLGGWRPSVFMQNGLAVALWMCLAALVGFWLWRTGAFKRLWGIPAGWVAAILMFMALACRGLGGIVALGIGLICMQGVRWTGRLWPVWLVVGISVFYVTTRTAGWWHGEPAVSIAQMIDKDRAASFEFRLRNEDILVNKAMQRPAFGWGSWGRSRVYNEKGQDISITDGMWVIALGNTGLLGLTSFMLMMLLPVVLLARRLPAAWWSHPTTASAAVLACLLGLFMIDNLVNAMMNPILILACGGLNSVVGGGHKKPA
ncbi:MAG: hypothetical protein IT443_13955 [Phycisphaeraceae bacterium]|nr:hypothetical protein [Phycisphaeraceae bacterium]